MVGCFYALANTGCCSSVLMLSLRGHNTALAGPVVGRSRPAVRANRSAEFRILGQASYTRSGEASRNSAGTGARGMSPDVLAMFNEAQKNIMELNRSRLKALDELKAAKQRIAELENKLEEVNKSRMAAAAEVVQPAPAMVTPAPPVVSQPLVQEQVPEEKPAAIPVTGILLAYETGWSEVFLHYNADNKGWTQIPGQPMEDGTGDLAGYKVISVEAKKLEFAFNNGKDWDSNQNRNYTIDGLGTYRVSNGRISNVKR